MVRVYSYNEMEIIETINSILILLALGIHSNRSECGVRPGGSVSLIKGGHNLGPLFISQKNKMLTFLLERAYIFLHQKAFAIFITITPLLTIS